MWTQAILNAIIFVCVCLCVVYSNECEWNTVFIHSTLTYVENTSVTVWDDRIILFANVQCVCVCMSFVGAFSIYFCIMLSDVSCRMSLFACLLLVFFAHRLCAELIYVCEYTSNCVALEIHLIIVMLCLQSRAVESRASTSSHFILFIT